MIEPHGEGEGALGWIVDRVLVVLPYFRLLLVTTTNDLDVLGSMLYIELNIPTKAYLFLGVRCLDGTHLLGTFT